MVHLRFGAFGVGFGSCWSGSRARVGAITAAKVCGVRHAWCMTITASVVLGFLGYGGSIVTVVASKPE